jgi:hypothetical protein
VKSSGNTKSPNNCSHKHLFVIAPQHQLSASLARTDLGFRNLFRNSDRSLWTVEKEPEFQPKLVVAKNLRHFCCVGKKVPPEDQQTGFSEVRDRCSYCNKKMDAMNINNSSFRLLLTAPYFSHIASASPRHAQGTVKDQKGSVVPGRKLRHAQSSDGN